MKRHIAEPSFEPLSIALSQLEAWLARDGASRIIVAKRSLQELKAQRLPQHINVTPKKRVGKRIATRGRRNYYESRGKLATWPDDAQDENSIPSIACMLSGQAEFHIADYLISCRAGDCLLIPPAVPKQDGSKSHFEGDPTGRACEILWIYTGITQTDGISCWICRSEGSSHLKPENSSCRIEHRFLAQLFNQFCSETLTTSRPEIVERLFALVLLLIRSEIEAGKALEDWGRPRYQGTDKQKSPITQALAYIEEHLDEHLTIEKVARQVILSPATFTRHFKQETGQTFTEYQTQFRLKVAEKLLLTTDIPLSQICSRIGLKYGQMWSLFQKAHGCSPSEFRFRKH
jgi:AraC-like DNA-binding protein